MMWYKCENAIQLFYHGFRTKLFVLVFLFHGISKVCCLAQWQDAGAFQIVLSKQQNHEENNECLNECIFVFGVCDCSFSAFYDNGLNG